jgi:uncharacterized membrane protein (DUF485 family)
MIFQVLKIGLQGKNFAKDPKGFAVDEARSLIVGFLVGPVIISLLILGLLGVLSFTSWLGGPYSIAMVIFWLFAMVFIVMSIVVVKILSMIRKATREQNVIYTEVEVEE